MIHLLWLCLIKCVATFLLPRAAALFTFYVLHGVYKRCLLSLSLSPLFMGEKTNVCNHSHAATAITHVDRENMKGGWGVLSTSALHYTQGKIICSYPFILLLLFFLPHMKHRNNEFSFGYSFPSLPTLMQGCVQGFLTLGRLSLSVIFS